MSGLNITSGESWSRIHLFDHFGSDAVNEIRHLASGHSALLLAEFSDGIPDDRIRYFHVLFAELILNSDHQLV